MIFSENKLKIALAILLWFSIWYTLYILKTNTQDTTEQCFQCGSPLILVSKVTKQLEGSVFPHTVYTYRCSNTVCEDEKIRERDKQEKLRLEREIANQKRLQVRKSKHRSS